jgi:hypothetical protein
MTEKPQLTNRPAGEEAHEAPRTALAAALRPRGPERGASGSRTRISRAGRGVLPLARLPRTAGPTGPVQRVRPRGLSGTGGSSGARSGAPS